MYLGGTSWHVDDANCPGNRSDGLRYQADRSSSQTDALRGLTDAPSISNKAETEVISHGEGVSTYLSAGGANCIVEKTDGIGSYTDASTGQTDAPNVKMDALIPANETQNVRIP